MTAPSPKKRFFGDVAAARRRLAALSRPDPCGCRVWIGTKSRGYGQIKVDGVNFYAHRLNWEIERGEIPEGFLVLHECDNPACITLEHLFLGTYQDNMDDKVRKGRQARGEAHRTATAGQAVGEKNGRAKLTEKDVLEIRFMAGTQPTIAKKYNISKTVVSKIKSGQSWKHLASLGPMDQQ